MPKQKDAPVMEEQDVVELAAIVEEQPVAEPAPIEERILLADWLAERMRQETGHEAAIVFAGRYGASADTASEIRRRFEVFMNAPA
jgi:hypothetical protein